MGEWVGGWVRSGRVRSGRVRSGRVRMCWAGERGWRGATGDAGELNTNIPQHNHPRLS